MLPAPSIHIRYQIQRFYELLSEPSLVDGEVLVKVGRTSSLRLLKDMLKLLDQLKVINWVIAIHLCLSILIIN